MAFAGLTLPLLLTAATALPPVEAPFLVGQVATIQGTAKVDRTPAGEIYIDLGGKGDAAPISAYISRWNAVKFQDVGTLDGKTVQIRGRISTFRGRPEIFLTSPDQIATK